MRRDRRDAVMGSGVGVGAEVPSVALCLDLNRLGRWSRHPNEVVWP